MRGVIRKATADDAEAVTALRIAAYSASNEFTLLATTDLAWGHDDESATVLVAISDEGFLVSTMRAKVFESKRDFEESSGFDLSGVELPIPTLFLDRAATKTDSLRSGTNSVLRYCFLRAALVQNLSSVSGWLFSGVTRADTMAQIGYTFTVLQAMDPMVFRHMESCERSYVVAVLAQCRIPAACLQLEKRLGARLNDWGVSGDKLPYRESDLFSGLRSLRA